MATSISRPGFGIFVELKDIYVEGLVHVTALRSDYYHFDPVSNRLIGKRTNMSYGLGDAVNVRVALEQMKVLMEKVADEKKYNDQHCSTVKFYYGFTLLITNPQKYKDDNVLCFEGKRSRDRVEVALELFKNPALFFSHEVKREVFTKIGNLESQDPIVKKLQLEAAALLVKLPPVVSPVEVTAPPVPTAAVSASPTNDFVPVYPTSTDSNSSVPVDAPSSVIEVDETPPPSFASSLDDAESVAGLKSELEILKLLYQQSLVSQAQKDELLQQKNATLQAARADLAKAQQEVERLNRRAAKFSDLRSGILGKQKVLIAELEAPIDSDEKGSALFRYNC